MVALPALSIRQPDVGNALLQASQIQGAQTANRLRNRELELTEQELENERVRAAARGRVQPAIAGAGTGPEAMTGARAALTAEASVLSQEELEGYIALLDQADDRQIAQVDSANDQTREVLMSIESLDPLQRRAVWPQLRQSLGEQGMDISTIPEQYSPEYSQTQLARLGAIDDLVKARLEGVPTGYRPTEEGGVELRPGYAEGQGRLAEATAKPAKPSYKNALFPDGSTEVIDANDPAAIADVNARGGKLVGLSVQATDEADLLRAGPSPELISERPEGPDILGPGKAFEDLVAESSGVWEQLGQGIDSVLGGLGVSGPFFPETAQAKRAVRLINKSVTQGLVENPRFPVYEQQLVRDMLPSPDAWFRGDEQAVHEAATLREYLKALKKQYDWERDQAPNITKEKRDQAADKAVVLDRILTMMGGPGKNTIADFQAGTRQAPFKPQTDEEYEKIPKGMWFEDDEGVKQK